MAEHLDLDALADVLSALDAGEPAPAHLAGCDLCTQALADLSAALVLVDDDLTAYAGSGLPEMPTGLDDRVTAALVQERQTPSAAAPAGGPESIGSTATVVPIGSRQRRWLPIAGGAAAAAVLVVGAIALLNGSHPSHSSDKTSTTAEGNPGKTILAKSETGTDYTRSNASLKANLPQLLQGGSTAFDSSQVGGGTTSSDKASPASGAAAPRAIAPSASDPLATLRTPAGLTACLGSLSDPGQTSAPLAIDYARYEGKPAMVVVLPSTESGKLDVFIVGPSCPDGSFLEFVRVARP